MSVDSWKLGGYPGVHCCLDTWKEGGAVDGKFNTCIV